jgi:hypothetical protein
MTHAVAQILEEVDQLSPSERAELADHIAGKLGHDIPPDLAKAQISEVRRRITQIEMGEILLVPGAEALAQVRRLVASQQATT